MAALRLIVGFGNPGADYARTRHNAGFWFLDALGESLGARFGVDGKLHAETAKSEIDGHPVWLLRPTTFMNRSGQSVSAALRYYKIEPDEMLVAHDELAAATDELAAQLAARSALVLRTTKRQVDAAVQPIDDCSPSAADEVAGMAAAFADPESRRLATEYLARVSSR